MASKVQLPEELMVEITSKLPVKSLMRFKCMNKAFYTLTTTKKFISKHFSNSTLAAQKNPSCFLILHLQDNYFSMTLVSEDDEPSQNSQPSTPIDLTPKLPFPKHFLDSIIAHGPSNGIFCLEVSVTRQPDRLILWNPITRETRVLPLPLPLPRTVDNSTWDYCSVVHGFGFDSETNDYKVVNVLVGQQVEDSKNDQSYAQVYSHRTNSWKMVDINVSTDGINSSMYSSLLNGVYHWLTMTNGVESILCFDMRKDEFWKMNLPQLSQGGDGELMDTNIAIINDRVAYIKEYNITSPLRTRVEIWVMNEYGVEESWTKRFVIVPNSPEQWRFWGFLKDDEVLIAAIGQGPLVVYNIDIQRRVREYFPVNFGMKFHVYRHVESIAPLYTSCPVEEEEEA